MPEVPFPPKCAIDADTDQALAWTREARKKLSPDDPEDVLYLRASTRLVRALRVEYPGLSMGRVLMSAEQGLDALRENYAEIGKRLDAGALLSILSLAAEQLAREEAEAGHACWPAVYLRQHSCPLPVAH